MQNVPKQVREQSEESDRLIAEANAAKTPTAEPIEKEKPAEQSGKIDPDNYKERYAKFKKATDLTISNLRGEVSQLTGQVNVLTQQNAEFIKQLQAKPTEVAQENSKPVNTNASVKDRILEVLTEEEKESYSPEFLDMLSRVNQVVNPSANQDSELTARLDNLEQTQHKTAEEKFWDAIDNGVPNWREVQASEEFQDYLNEYDPLLGATRLAVLTKAQSELNAERAIAVFTTHINGLANHNNAKEETINPLDKHVVPDATGAGDGSDIDVVPNLSEAEITQFYTDVALGKYTSRPSEMASMEDAIRKINAASKQSPTNVENKTSY